MKMIIDLVYCMIGLYIIFKKEFLLGNTDIIHNHRRAIEIK